MATTGFGTGDVGPVIAAENAYRANRTPENRSRLVQASIFYRRASGMSESSAIGSAAEYMTALERELGASGGGGGSSGGGGGGMQSPLPTDMTPEEESLRADLYARGLSVADINTIMAEYKAGTKTAAQIRADLGLGSGSAPTPTPTPTPSAPPADAIPAGDYEPFERTKFDEALASNPNNQLFSSLLSQMFPGGLASSARNVIQSKFDPLMGQYQLQAATGGSVPGLADFFKSNIQNPNFSGAAGQLGTLADLLNTGATQFGNEEQEGAFGQFRDSPEVQANVARDLLSQRVSPLFRSSYANVINRDYDRFRAPGGSTNTNFIDYLRQYGRLS